MKRKSDEQLLQASRKLRLIVGMHDTGMDPAARNQVHTLIDVISNELDTRITKMTEWRSKKRGSNVVEMPLRRAA